MKHVYELCIEGVPLTNKGEGILFGAESEDEAKCRAYRTAHWRSCLLDQIDLEKGVQYPTHAYKLYQRSRFDQQNKLLVDYTPPNPEDVKSGKVTMPKAMDVIAPYLYLFRS
jgi:hypothetical protein